MRALPHGAQREDVRMKRYLTIGAVAALLIVASWHFLPAAAEAG